MTKPRRHIVLTQKLLMAFIAIQFFFATPNANAVKLDSMPSFANVYHIKLGKKIHIGQLPTKLVPADFNNSDTARIIIYKPGYAQKKLNLDLTKATKMIQLEKLSNFVTANYGNQKKCVAQLKKSIEKYIYRFRGPLKVKLSSPIHINMDKKIIRIESKIFDHKLSKKIKSLKRKRNSKLLDKALAEANKPFVQGLLTLLKKTCIPRIELIAYIGDQSNKYVRVPYLQNYYDVSYYTSTNYVTGVTTKTTETSSGSRVKYKNKIVKKDETFYRRFLYGFDLAE